MFEDEIKEYESIRKEYQQKIADRMGKKQWMEYNEILFSAHSCAIEGNSFTVDDTRILREQGMAMIPVGRSLLECTEMADHFRAFDYMVENLEHPFDEELLKEVNRLVTEHTIAYRAQGAIAGEYTTEDMAAGDTVFGLLAKGGGKLAFVGDGINDAPVLMRADVGIAMGAMGSDAAIESADVVLMDDKPSKIAESIRIARKTMRIVWENIVFALAVKVQGRGT